MPIHEEAPFGDEEFVREGGTLRREKNGHEVRHEDGSIAPDDMVEDLIADEGVPGTPDDLPYDYGVEVAQPVDQMMSIVEHHNAGFGAMGETGAEDDADEPPLGGPEERELWRRQKPLVQESEDEAVRYAGLEGDDIAGIEGALGEDAAEVLPETPDGGSATGSA